MSSLSDQDGPGPASAVALIELLGTGRHGSVFRATYGPGRDHVAVKIPIDDLAAEEEARALRRFAHPHVVELLDGPLDNGALVLEPCVATLADRIGDAALAPDELVAVGHDVLAALDHLHLLGWVHGDVTPANVGLRTDGAAVLLDFATTRPIGDEPVTEGTPEFLGALRLATPALDLRAAAASLRLAAASPTRWEPDASGVVGALDAFIARADADEPVTSDDLRAVLDHPHPVDSISDPPASTVPRTQSFGPRPTSVAVPEPAPTRVRPGLAAVSLLMLVAAVLIGTELWGRAASAPPPADRSSATGATMPTAAGELDQRVVSASETLRNHDASWDGGWARLTIAATQGRRLIDVGDRGDQAAIADWNCDGEATLGLYRPATGAWYEFDSWDSATPAGPRLELAAGGELRVRVDPNGCARPQV